MKKRIVFGSLILILMLALVLPVAMPSEVQAQAPAPAIAPAPALEIAAEGAAFVSVDSAPAPVSAQTALPYASVAGLILITIVASVATFRRKIFTSIGQLIANLRSPDFGGPLKTPYARG